ncbi:MAG: hypothetical protein RLY43_5 [Bacteroidota bacterium]|jgi:hypothetical protein
MYTAKYLIYSYSLFTVSLIILSFSLIVILLNVRSKIKQKIPIINIVSNDINTEIYTALKSIGITLTIDQQRAFEQIVSERNSKIGFRGGEKD